MIESEKSPPAFQFSIRALLGVTTFCAFAAWLWPKSLAPVEMHVLLAIGIGALVTTIACARRAWRTSLARTASFEAASDRRWKARVAFVAGLLGVVPYLSFILVLMLDPFEAGHRAVHSVMFGLWCVSAYSVVPVIASLLASFVIYFRLNRDWPLFLMRAIGLITNFAWPVLFWVIIIRWI
jgi:uncharacterized membrane protein